MLVKPSMNHLMKAFKLDCLFFPAVCFSTPPCYIPLCLHPFAGSSFPCLSLSHQHSCVCALFSLWRTNPEVHGPLSVLFFTVVV